MLLKINRKKGLSVIVGYVLLIVITIVMASIVYQWIKTYLPKEQIDCPEDVSISISKIDCQKDASNIFLDIGLRNNGRFDINGYFIRSSEDVTAELAKIDLSQYIDPDSGTSQNLISSVRFKGNYVLEPNSEIEDSFEILLSNVSDIKFIEIIPIRFQDSNFVTCSNKKIREIVECL